MSSLTALPLCLLIAFFLSRNIKNNSIIINNNNNNINNNNNDNSNNYNSIYN